MQELKDLYPTRLDLPRKPFPRLDPVIHSEGAIRENGPLNAEQLQSYEENGFLILESFFSKQETDAFLDELAAYNKDASFKAREQVITEPTSQHIRSIFAIHELSPRFAELVRSPKLLGIATQLLGSDVYIHQSRINRKPGFAGAGFNWHSDFETWHSEDGMPRMRCFSASILLTENNDLNGPLMLIPGSHKWFIPTQGATPRDNWKRSLKEQTVGVPATEHLEQMAREKGIIAAKGAPGTLILFDCNTLHASANNLSPWPRSNLFFVYNSVDNGLVAPFGGTQPRPEFIATRKGEALKGAGGAKRKHAMGG